MDKNKKNKRRLFANFGLGSEKEYFIDNLSMLLASGMNISDSLEAIETELKSKQMKRIIKELKNDIEGGSNLWKALDKTDLFSAQIISLIRIGEQSGRLSENLKVINVQQKKERTFKSKIRSAMMYPVLILSLTVVVGFGIAWFILPRLSSVFSQLDMELPAITKVLINFGEFLGQYGYVVIPASIFIVLLFIYFLFFFKKTKQFGQLLFFNFPIVKNLIREVELSRFGYILGTLLEAGLPIIDALEALRSATSFKPYKNLYGHLKSSVEAGNSFKKSFESFKNINNLVPKPVQQMIVSGEKSGKMSEVLIKAGENYEEKTDNTTKNLTVVLEPIMLIIVWVGVVAVAMAVILPIYSLIGGLNS